MIAQRYLMEYVALSLYALFVGFCFCDGFRLGFGRKLFWFVVFGATSIYVLQARSEYDLAFILPLPTLLSVLLCSYELRKHSLARPR